jgi:tryptophan synthase alpha chain
MADTGAAQLGALFAAARADGRAVLLPYMTAGLPSPAESLGIFTAMADAGADGFEVGIPYSDPLMDGPTIHEAGLRAIDAGTALDTALGIVEDVVAGTRKPVVVMTYVNPVLRVGPETFAAWVRDAGGCGVIVADMPAEESYPFEDAFTAAGLGTVLFVAPTTDDARLAEIAARRPAFLYGVAELGVTGERAVVSSRAAELAHRVHAVTDIPLVLGVGISTPEHARAAAAVADGVIVGSALVRRVLDAPDGAAAAEELAKAVSALAAAVGGVRGVTK